jgi:hypothetical protein
MSVFLLAWEKSVKRQNLSGGDAESGLLSDDCELPKSRGSATFEYIVQRDNFG